MMMMMTMVMIVMMINKADPLPLSLLQPRSNKSIVLMMMLTTSYWEIQKNPKNPTDSTIKQQSYHTETIEISVMYG